MGKRFGFLLALAMCAALSVGVAPKAFAAGTTYNINAAADWPSGGSITLGDGDTLNISPAATSPITPTTIFIAANANATINGGGVMRTNLYVVESPYDTASHIVTINDLLITAPAGTLVYTEFFGTINLIGSNVLVGATDYLAFFASSDPAQYVANITSSTDGTLTVSSNNTKGFDTLFVHTLNVQGSAHVTFIASSSSRAVFAMSAVNVDSGASLDATSASSEAIDGLNLVVTNYGKLTASSGSASSPALLCSGVYMGADAVTSVTSIKPETISFSMIPASGYQWQLSGGATLVSPSTVASNPASISVAGGSAGVIKLVPNPPPPTVAMYRIMNPSTGEHFYTSSAKEVQVNVNSGAWKYEGIGWVAPLSGTPVFRLAAIPGTGSAGHLFTTSTKERDAALASRNAAGQPYWRCETGVGMPSCVGWFSGGSIPVFRAYYPGSGQHNYTTDTNEQRVITGKGPLGGWNDEGVGWYGVATGDPHAPMPV